MTIGSVLGVVSLLVVATAPNPPIFFVGWALAGFAMASTFYQPAFAALTRWWAPDHVRALTIVTLAGGLASTVFAPLTAALADHLSWRHTYLVLACILAAVTIPAHALALREPWPDAPTNPTQTAAGATKVGRSRPFLLLAAAFTLSGFAMYAVVVALVPLLLERGYTTGQAAWALGIGGAGQTLYAALARRTTPTARTTILIALGALTTAAFAAAPGPYPLLIALSVTAGMVRGNLTLLQATAITDRWGTTHYGRLSGLLAAPATTAAALAPFAGAALAVPLGGYGPLFCVLAAVSVAAALTAPWTGAAERLSSPSFDDSDDLHGRVSAGPSGAGAAAYEFQLRIRLVDRRHSGRAWSLPLARRRSGCRRLWGSSRSAACGATGRSWRSSRGTGWRRSRRPQRRRYRPRAPTPGSAGQR